MAIPLRILLIEDDPIQAEYICEEIIWPVIPSADIKYCDSEYSFENELKDLVPSRWWPSHALVDQRIRYYSPQDMLKRQSEGLPSDARVINATEGGIRCIEAIEKLQPRPEIALMSVFDISKQPLGVAVLQKGDDEFGIRVIEFLKRR